MRLPVQAIGSFQRHCLEDINRIWSFMENKTLEELRSYHSVHILGGFRNILSLQFSQKNRAWRNHKPGDGDADVNTIAKLGTIVESTRVAVAHVLKISGDAISIQILWRPTEPLDPIPYTFLSQFYRMAMPSAHPDSPLAQKLPHHDSAASRASHMSLAPSSGQPDYVTPVVTSRERKATIHSTVPTRPNSASAPAEAIEQRQPEATPTFIRLTREHAPPTSGGSPTPRLRHRTTGLLQEEVVVKRSSHAPAVPEEAWHASFANARLISIGGQNTGVRPPPTRFAQLERAPPKRAPLKDRRTTSKAPDMASPTVSTHLSHLPKARPIKPKAGIHQDGQVKGKDKQSDDHRLAMQLDVTRLA